MPMYECLICQQEFDPVKDFFITVSERKGPSFNFCSLSCATRYLKED